MNKWTAQRDIVFKDRYALRDENGNLIETTPEQMWRRVANTVGQNAGERMQFYEILKDFKFVPGGRILSGAGTERLVTFYNCYVIPVRSSDPSKGNDSRQGIMDTIKTIVEITSRGGGVGVNWSTLRPRGAYVKGVNGTSSGPVSWMIGADAIIQQVEQGGSRRGAQMYMLDDWHPSVIEFIQAKQDLKVIQSANLSVGVSDKFMKAVEKDEDWTFIFPDTKHPDYNKVWNGDIQEWLDRGLPVVEYGTIGARELWNMICESAWKCGEPGVVWTERYNKMSNTWYLERIRCVNPCGEQGLGEWGVCNLGSINLAAFVKNNKLDFESLGSTIAVAVRFLDNVIEINQYINEEMKNHQFKVRRVGLGTMGLADALLLLGLRYGSDEAASFVELLFKFIRDEAYKASIQLAKERGPAPGFDKEKYLQGEFIQRLPQEIIESIATHGIRNLVLLTQAPTGTTSILAGVSSGIEPIYSWTYKRKDRTGEHIVKHPLYEQYEGKELPSYFVTAMELTPEEHVRMQAAIQKYVDSSISKTVNAPQNHTVDQVKKLFTLAYKLGCKGITYYREGSREGVLQTIKEQSLEPCKRPRKLQGVTVDWETPLGKLFVTLNRNPEGRPFEVFCQIGKAGSDVAAFTEAIARLISLCLRSGVDIKHVVDQLYGIGGYMQIGFGANRVRSVPDAIAQALHYLIDDKIIGTELGICPSCGAGALVQEEGCSKCMSCGYSQC
jgi:ribonucleoside-diphosphate reductase alpha chain